ncbi:MAG TPA: histidine kinase [Thermomicrobiales bacterium]|nr:histidine kinase [Thermomicrobiales bacterium]
MTGSYDTTANAADRLGLDVLASIMDASLDGIVVIDDNRRYLYVNPAACRILGRPASELIGADILINFPAHQHEQVLGVFKQMSLGNGGRNDSTIVLPSGEERQIEFTDTRFMADGRQLRTAIFRDVTESRRQEREARVLAEIAASLTIDQPMEETLDVLTNFVVEETGAKAAVIALIEPETMHLDAFTVRGLPERFMEKMRERWPMSRNSVTVRAIETQQIEVVCNARARMLTNMAYASVHNELVDANWDALAAVPLVYHGESHGALLAYYPNPGPPDGEIALLAAIADQAAIVVENNRLYAEAQGQAAIEERQRLARELHDSVSQALYGIGLGARTARTLIGQDPARAVAPVEYVLQLAEAGLAEMRALIFELRPESLEAEGLVAAIGKQAASLFARHRIVVNSVLCDEPAVPLPIKEAVYRIIQEGLHNVVKHSHATTVDLRLECDDTIVRFDIRDNGVGFDPAGEFPGHLGLQSMRERAARLGGVVEIESSPRQGSRIHGFVPCHG